MRHRARSNLGSLLVLAIGLGGPSCSRPPAASPTPLVVSLAPPPASLTPPAASLAVPAASPTASAAAVASAGATPPPVESATQLRRGTTFPPPKPRTLAPPRVVGVPAACSGPALLLDAKLEACVCGEPDEWLADDGHVVTSAGTGCGAPHADEAGPPPRLTLALERPTVASGGVARVSVTLDNDAPLARRYRVHDRRLAVRFMRADGTALPAVLGWDGSYREEALIALPAGGRAVLVLEAEASMWPARNGRYVRKPLPPGKYAIEVRLGSLGGTHLVPIQVR
jgi:hypothetical protein